MGEAVQKKGIGKELIWVIVGLIVFLVLRNVISPGDGLTKTGVDLLAIFIMTIVLWIGAGSKIWVGFMSFVMVTMFGVLTPTELFAGTFGNSNVAFTLGILILTAAMEATGVAKLITQWFLSRKMIKGHYYRFLILIGIAIYLISILTSGLLAIITAAMICLQVMKELGVVRGEKLYNATMLWILWTPTLGDLMIPYGKINTVVFMGQAATMGMNFDYTDWMIYSIPLNILFFFVALLLIRFIVRPDTEKFDKYSADRILEEMKANPLTKSGKFSVAMLIACFLMLIMPLCTFMPAVAEYFANLGCIPYYIVALAMAVVTIDGKTVISLEDISKKTGWQIVMLLALVMLFSANIGQEQFGVVSWLTARLSPIAASMSPILLLIIACVITCLMTNFSSNFVTLALATTVFVPLFAQMYEAGIFGLHPVAAFALFSFISLYAFLAPPGSPTTVVMIGPYIDMKASFRPSLLFLAIIIVVLVFFSMAVGGILA